MPSYVALLFGRHHIRKVFIMTETLAYWNLRAVEAKIDVDEDITPQTCEQLAFARAMVKIIEKQLFSRKGTK